MQNLFSAFATGSRSYKMNPATVKCYSIDNVSDLNGMFTMRVIMIIIKYRHMQQAWTSLYATLQVPGSEQMQKVNRCVKVPQKMIVSRACVCKML